MYIKILKMSYSCLYTLYFRACFYVVHHIMSYQGTILEKEKYIYRILIYIYIYTCDIFFCSFKGRGFDSQKFPSLDS